VGIERSSWYLFALIDRDGQAVLAESALRRGRRQLHLTQAAEAYGWSIRVGESEGGGVRFEFATADPELERTA
jgi:hypothetical protein